MPDPEGEASHGRVVLVRHGETEWSRAGRHTGRTDVGLTPLGERQARSLAPALVARSFGRVLVSPLERAQRTARLAGLTGFETHGDLAEWDYGRYEGLTTEQIVAQYGDDWLVWDADGERYPLPGESLERLGERVDGVLSEIAPTLVAGLDVLLVAHGHVLRVLASRWIGQAPRLGARLVLSTGALSELGLAHGRRAILHWNVAAPPG